MSSRYLTMLGVIAAALALIFHFAGIGGPIEPILTDGSIILVGSGVLTGY